MPLFLCVDCGGSKTSAVVCDEDGKILGRAYGGPSNFAYLTVEAFISAVRLTVSDALKTCVSPPSIEPVALPPSMEIAAAWFGVSGVDSPASVATITPVLSTLLGIPQGPRLVVANDTHLLAAPLRRISDVSQVVAVIGGTGSIAVSFELVEGTIEEQGRIGGWGWVLGDEGGGYNVGRELIRQLLLENDKASVAASPPASTKLKTKVLEIFRSKSVPEILPAIHWPDPPAGVGHAPDAPAYLTQSREKRLSSLSPFVFEAAFQDNDPIALEVLRICAGVLASQILVLLGRKTEEKPKLVDATDAVISFGGSLVGVEGYRKLILDELQSHGHTFKHVEFINDAAATGAVGLAAAFKP